MDYARQAELAELAKPLREWLMKHYNPHTEIVIDYDGVHVKEDVLFTRI